MAKNRQTGAADDIKPADGFTPAASFGDDGPHETVTIDASALGAEIEQLRQQVAAQSAKTAELEQLRRKLAAIENERDIDHPLANDPALRSPVSAADEILRLREQLAAAKAGGPAFAPGQKYRVSIKDGPTAVVQCEGIEHPFDAYKRATGVLSSVHAPEIHPAPDDAACGTCDHTGTVPTVKA